MRRRSLASGGRRTPWEAGNGDEEAGHRRQRQRQEGAGRGDEEALDRQYAGQDSQCLGKRGAAVAQRKRTGESSPKTRQELYDIAKRKNLAGRSKMGRDELARALGYK